MLLLATGAAEAKQDGEHIRLSIPNGDETVEIALSYHLAMRLAVEVHSVMKETFASFETPEGAQIIPMKRAAATA